MNPFGILHLPGDCWVELKPVVTPEGKTLRRMQLKGTDQVSTQVEQKLIPMGEVTVQPMKMPSGSVFYEEYRYGGKTDKES